MIASQRILVDVYSLLLLLFAFALARGAFRSGRLRTDVVDVAEEDVLVAVVRETSQPEERKPTIRGDKQASFRIFARVVTETNDEVAERAV